MRLRRWQGGTSRTRGCNLDWKSQLSGKWLKVVGKALVLTLEGS